MNDNALRRIEDVARWLRAKGHGRATHPAEVLLHAADWLTSPLDSEDTRARCQRCRNPLPPYRGRGRGRKVCESCRPPRIGQYRANIPQLEKVNS